jgi:hypothetical protein
MAFEIDGSHDAGPNGLDPLGGPGLVKKGMKMLSSMSLLSLIAFNVLALLGIVTSDVNAPIETARTMVVNKLLRLYLTAFAALSLFLECECQMAVSSAGLLSNWMARGAWLTFSGILTLSFRPTVGPAFQLPQDVIAFSLIGCGTLYMLLAACCVQYILRRRETKYHKFQIISEEKSQLEDRQEQMRRDLGLPV